MAHDLCGGSRAFGDEVSQRADGLEDLARDVVVLYDDPEALLQAGHELEDGQRVQLGDPPEQHGRRIQLVRDGDNASPCG